MKKLFILATAAVALASCSDSDLVGNIASSQQTEQPQAVEFGTYMGSSATRAGVAGTITTASLKTGTHSAGFGVMGYQMTADWTNNQATDKPDFMYNQQITWNAGGFWTYSPVKYWPNGIDKANADNDPSNTAVSTNGDKLNFFAYAPWVDVAFGSGTSGDYTAAASTIEIPSGSHSAFYAQGCSSTSLTSGITALTHNTLQAAPEVMYFMPTATDAAAVDLIWGLRGSTTYNETDNVNNTVTELGNSYNVNLTKQDVPETVNFLFKHALAKIGGNTKSATSTTGTQKCGLKVVLDIDGNGNGINGVDNQSLYLGGTGFSNTSTLVTLKSVAVQDGASAYAERASQTDPKNALPDDPVITSDLKNSGWFNLATGAWNNIGNITNTGSTTGALGATYTITADRAGTYQINPDIAEPASTPAIDGSDKSKWATGENIPTGVVASTAKNVYSNATDVPALLLIPNGATAQTLYVTVDYLVRTADPKLSTGYSEVEQTVTNKVSLAGLETNKYYTLVMHLGLTSVKFSAIVADWANSDDASYDEGGTNEGTAEAAEEVWLPSNVIAVSTTNSSSPELGTSYNENLKASTTSYTVNLAGLAKDQKITATFAAPITAVSIDGNALTSGTPSTLTDANPAGVVTVTLTANTKVAAAKSLLTILQEASDGTDLTTTSINFVQSGYDINLTGTTGTVTVKDDENNNVPASSLTVVVKDATTGVVLTPSTDYTVTDGTITITKTGTFNVIVTYTDSASKTVTKTIQTTKS